MSLCGTGLSACNNTCVDTRTDTTNCGACGNVCGAGLVCSRGQCSRYLEVVSPLPFINACAQTGAVTVMPNSDDSVTNVTLPFSFRYFGVNTTAAWVSTNGVVGIGSPASNAYSNTCLPSGLPGSVMAFWDDLISRSGVCYATIGTAPDRQFVATWNDSNGYSWTADLTFTVVLSESTNTIDVQYGTMTSSSDPSRATGSSATIGLESIDGASYLSRSCNADSTVSSNTGVRYVPVF